jgi:homoserine dehydrogenase
MERERVSFNEALAEAQTLGFAEADPSQDIKGLDAQAKLAILAHIAFGVHVRASAIKTRGVDVIDTVDFVYAEQMGCTIRQIAWAEPSSEPAVLRAGVGPALVPLESPLARVRGCENLVTLHGRFGGETTFGGLGAGGEPTAVAVLSDLLAIAREGARPAARVPASRVEVSADSTSAYYVRFTVADRPGIIAALSSVFGQHGINIDAILQQPGFPAGRRPFVVTLDPSPSSAIEQAMNDMSQFDFHGEAPVVLPVFSAATIGVLA